jgi:hypothetical protein
MAPTAKVIKLTGNKANGAESAEHIIVFPGGSISVCRTSNNEYWVHIEVNKGQIVPGTVRESARGTIVDSRMDFPGEVIEIPNQEQLMHIAVRIKI